MLEDLRNKTISGVFWSFLQKVGSRGLTFLVTIVLARLLTPKDFGLIGMITIFIQISQSLLNAGFNQALIQKKEVDEEDYSSVFYINLIVSFFIYALLYLSAPFISRFYDQEILIPLIRVLSITFVINAFAWTQQTRLSKEMRFKTLTIIQIPSVVIGGFVSIVMAIYGCGVWSIVFLQLVSRLIFAIQIWIYSKWKPLLSFNKKKARKLFSFGSKLMIAGLITTIYNNIYLVIIGKFFQINTVGYYQNADNLVKYPTTTITGVLAGVTFPAFSTIQENNERLKNGYKKVLQQLLFWLCPAFILAGVLAVPLFDLIFTSKWLPAVPYFRWLCVVGVFYPLSTYNLEIITVKGHSALFLKLTLLNRVFTTIGIIFAISFGIDALLIFQAINSIFSYLLNAYFSSRFIKYSISDQIRDILPILIMGITIGGIVLLFNHTFYFLPDILRVAIGLFIGIVLYLASAKKMRLDPYNEFMKIFHNRYLALFNK